MNTEQIIEEMKREAREVLRAEIKKFPQMDALGTTDVLDILLTTTAQRVREDTEKYIYNRMEKGIQEFRITEEVPPFYQTKQDKEATAEVRQAMRFLKKYVFEPTKLSTLNK